MLKTDCNSKQLHEMKKDVESSEKQLLEQFENIKAKSTMDTESVRKKDVCVAITHKVVRIANEMLSEIDAFDSRLEFKKLETLKRTFVSQFVFSEQCSSSSMSNHSHISEKAADAAAELALKQAELRMLDKLREENARSVKLEQARQNHKQFILEQENQLKRLALEREVEIAGARMKAYQTALKEDSQPSEIALQYTDTENQEKALADSVTLNRLPALEQRVAVYPEKSTMNIDIATFRARIGLFGPGRGIKIHSSKAKYNRWSRGSHIHFHMMALEQF